MDTEQFKQDQEKLRLLARLHESEARFRVVADSAPVPMWVDGPDGACEFVNKAYLDFFGKTWEEMQGFGWQLYMHPDDRERYVNAYLVAFQARAPFHCQVRFMSAKGEYRWLDSVGLPRFSASGEFLGYAGASPDITEAKRAELHTQFINQLDLALSQMTNTDEIVRLATAKLGEYMDVTRCYVSRIIVPRDQVIVRKAWEGWLRGVPSVAGEYRISDFISADFRKAMETGQPATIADVTTDLRTRDFIANYEFVGIRAVVTAPVVNEGVLEATLTVAQPQPRDWRPDEVQLMRDTTARIWLAIRKARTIESLRESEERARRTLADQMLAGIAEGDSEGRFSLVNERFCNLTGYSKTELLKMQVRDITYPDDWPLNRELHRRLFETGESFFMEKRYLRKDGSVIWVHNHVSPIRNAQGKVGECVAVVIDVTARKRAEQELAAAKDRLAADLDAMTRLQRIGAVFVREGDLPAVLGEVVAAAIAISGATKGNIQLLNQASGNLDLAAQRGFDQTFLDYWDSARPGAGACGAAMRLGQRVIVEDISNSPIFAGTPDLDAMLQAGVQAAQSTPVMSRSGKLLAVLSTHFPAPHCPDERALRLLDLLASQTADIIERAGAEADLRSAYRQAEAATHAKDEFLAVVSHELRSPLTAVLGYARLLRSETADSAQIKQMAEIIERNGRMQLQLIEDLLDIARIISGKLKLEVQPVDLVTVITAALDVVRPALQAKGIELYASLDPLAGQVTGDPDRLQQVVWNLLSNAIKFTPHAGRTEVVLRREDPHVQVIVRDNGKGIDREFLPHIFERFRQSDMSSTRRVGGLGLGLSLVKHLVELHGGTVEAESAGAGQGSIFTIRLPLRAIYTAPPTEPKSMASILSAATESLRGLRALIVDDEEDVRLLLTMTLESYGARTHAISSGRQALELLDRQTPYERFDVLICDIGMPDEDGYSVIRKVRKLPVEKGSQIPAIALTAYGRAEDRVRALGAGFQMHIAKPVEPDELVAVIQSLVKRFGASSRSAGSS